VGDLSVRENRGAGVYPQNGAALMLKVSNLTLLGAHISIATVTAGELNPKFFVSTASMAFAALSRFSMHARLEPHKPRGVGFPKTGARDERGEHRRFFEDLADAWKMQDMCGGPYERYNNLRALV
jgi:hypothetical protein